MTAHIFIGPSGRHLPATSFPNGIERHGPIQHGDLLRLDLGPGEVVGIVDGLFYDRPAIKHKEILMAAANGARIIGGSSIGALRAADLIGFGMDGVGQVFSWLTSGVIVADHEVAVLHGDSDSGYRPMTVALVSVRDVLGRLVKIGGLSEAQAHQVLDTLGCMYFADRTSAALQEACAAAKVPASVYGGIREAVEGRHDVKVRDAAEVVAAVLAMRYETTAAQAVLGPAGQPSDNYQVWVRELSLDDPATAHLAKARAVQALQLFTDDMPAIYGEAVRRQLAAEWGVASSSRTIAEMFALRTGVKAVDEALAAQWLYPAVSGAPDEDLCRLAVASYRVNPSLPAWGALHEFLEQQDAFADLVSYVSEAETGFLHSGQRQRPSDHPAPHTVLAWVGHLWDCGDDMDVLRRAGYARGFRDVKEIYRTAARFLANGIGETSLARLKEFVWADG